MHPHLAPHRLNAFHTNLCEQTAALVGWLDNLDGHLYRLYLLTGTQVYLTALIITERLRTQATAAGTYSSASLPELGELTKHLHSITLLLSGQVDQEDNRTPGSGC